VYWKTVYTSKLPSIGTANAAFKEEMTKPTKLLVWKRAEATPKRAEATINPRRR
jgi:hypothetical protein